MSRIYGVTCDRCKGKIDSPVNHKIVNVKEGFGNNFLLKKDLCTICYFRLQQFLSQEIGETK